MQLRCNFRSAVIAFLTIPAIAFAQEPIPPATPAPAPEAQPPPAEGTGERKKAEEEIVVTGTRVRRKDLSTPAPITVISRQQLQSSATPAIGDFLQLMPEQGNATNTQVNNGGNGTTQVSLRSLGSQRTLVLIDGKRMVTSGSGADAAVDLNTIPTAAIERVEVLKDGASAVYGSDAIAGVVNLITRRRLNGTEANAYAGVSQKGDAQVYDLSVTAGAAGERGGFLFGAGYYDQRSFLAGDRDWAKFAINYDYTDPTQTEGHGGSSRVPQGRARVNPSKCAAQSQVCADLVAAGITTTKNLIYDPGSPGAVDGWRVFNSNTDLYNYQAVNFLITPATRISLFANGEYKIGENARSYFQGSFVNRQWSNLLAPEPFDTGNLGITLSKDNQYNPFKTDIAVVRKRLVSASGRSASADIDTYRVVAGVDGTFPDEFGPAKGFFWDFALNYGRSTGTTITSGSINAIQAAAAVGPSFQDAQNVWHCGTVTNPIPGCTPPNLFGVNNPSPDQLASLGFERLINNGFNQMTAATANLSGELFKLASDRPAGLALGYEYRMVYGGFNPDWIAQQTFTNPHGFNTFVDSDYGSQPTRGSYHVNEGYAELDVPVMSNAPLVDDLEIQGAFRVFNYSTFGTDSTYKIGGRWRPIRDVTLRATYSTAFRAPSVSELYSGRGPSAEPAIDPCGGGANGKVTGVIATQCGAAANNGDDNVQINSNVGGTSGLKPEKANAFTMGVVLEPQMIRGLTVTVDYYALGVTNTIVGGNLTQIYLNACYPGAGGTPDPVACAHVNRDPATQQITVVDDYNNNLGELNTSGIDLSGRYSLPSDYGRFGFLMDANILIKQDQKLFTLLKGAGNYDLGVNPRLKFNAGLNWSMFGLSAGLIGKFVGGFTECAASDGSNAGGLCSQHGLDDTGKPYPDHSVKPEMTFDVYVNYLLKNPLGTTTLGVGVRNALNTNPVRIYNSFLTYADPSAYDFVGRYVYARVGHTF
jgi:outer membrane receptor protein involved in Fe transport